MDPFTGRPMPGGVYNDHFSPEELSQYLSEMGLATAPQVPVAVTPAPDLGPPIDAPQVVDTRGWVAFRATMDLDLWFRVESVEGNTRDEIYGKIMAALGGQSGWWLPNLTYQIRDLRRPDAATQPQAQAVASPGPAPVNAVPAAPATGRPGSLGHPDGRGTGDEPRGQGPLWDGASEEPPGTGRWGTRDDLDSRDRRASQDNAFAAFIEQLRVEAIIGLGRNVSPDEVIEYLAARQRENALDPAAGLQLDSPGRRPSVRPGHDEADAGAAEPGNVEYGGITAAARRIWAEGARPHGREEADGAELDAAGVHRDQPGKPASRKRRSARGGQSADGSTRKTPVEAPPNDRSGRGAAMAGASVAKIERQSSDPDGS